MNIYQISNELQKVFCDFNETYDENGEITEYAMQKINSLQCSMEEKCISLGAYILNIEAETRAVSDAEKAIKDRRSRLEKKVNDLQDYLKVNMEKSGISEISGSPYFTIKLKKNPVSVFIHDEAQISSEFKKVKEVTTIDKTKIKDHILSGISVVGAELVQNTRLEIK